MLLARDVSVSLGRKPVVRSVNLCASPGQTTVLVGPNGSGKTTTLRALSGDVAYSGSVTLNGREITSMHSAQRAAMRAVLPQATTLSFPFTVREVVSMGTIGGYAGVPEAEVPALVGQALARVDLAGFAGRYYQELSGGEQQRVQLARVLCQVWRPVLNGVPRFLLLDEPVSSLDIKHQLAILGIARDFARAGGGVIAVLHDLNLAAMFADRLVVMDGGRIAAQGEPSSILRDDLIEATFGCPLRVGRLPPDSNLFVLPQSAMA